MKIERIAMYVRDLEKAKVNELTKKLENDGCKVMSGPRVTDDGYYDSAILAFEENIIELTI